MAYVIQPSDKVQPEIRRIAVECLDRALGKLVGLDDRSPEAIEEAIHDVRKRCKEVRALARLVRRSLGSDWRPFNALVRDASDELSSIRDAHAVAATLHDLRATSHGEHDAELEIVHAAQTRIAKTATQNIRAGDARVERALELLTAARTSVDRWTVESGSEWLVAGIAASYRGSRRDLRRARSRSTDPRLHEWRKRIKTLWYQMRLLEAAAPSVLTPLVARLDDLAEALGDDHDLSVLIKRLESDPSRFGGKKVVKRAVRRARAQQDDLRRRAFRLGASLLAEQVPAFVARINKYWSTTVETGIELATGGIAKLPAGQIAAEDAKVGERYEPPTRSLEIERKFLVSNLPELPDKGTAFRQGYLAIEDSVSLRVRDADQEGCTLTVKAGRGSVRTELEWPIGRDQFDALWELTAHRRIEKVRHTIPISPGGTGGTDLVAEVDVFHGRLEGLLIAEVEFESVESMDRFSPPDWFGSEVTDDVSYTNASLSMAPPCSMGQIGN